MAAPTGIIGPDNQAMAFAEAITPHDSTHLSRTTRRVYVGGAGAVAAVMAGDGAVVTFAAVPVGTVLPISVSRINSTGTTATNLVAIY